MFTSHSFDFESTKLCTSVDVICWKVVLLKVYGSMELVKSDWLELQSTICADPPEISVAVVGLDERRQLERNICDLINKRDRLLKE